MYIYKYIYICIHTRDSNIVGSTRCVTLLLHLSLALSSLSLHTHMYVCLYDIHT